MGVKGLQSYIDERCPGALRNVNLRHIAEDYKRRYQRQPTLVIDGSGFLRKLYPPRLDWIYGGQWVQFASDAKRLMVKFKEAGIEAVFIFDGVVERKKRETWIKRRRNDCRLVAKIFQFIKEKRRHPDGHMYFIPTGLVTFCQEALKAAGATVVNSVVDADKEIYMYYQNKNCFGVLGRDSDFLIYDIHHYFNVQDFNLMTFSVTLYDKDTICKHLGLEAHQFPLLACLLGNDITTDTLESFHRRLFNLKQNEKLPSYKERVRKVAAYIHDLDVRELDSEFLRNLEHDVSGRNRDIFLMIVNDYTLKDFTKDPVYKSVGFHNIQATQAQTKTQPDVTNLFVDKYLAMRVKPDINSEVKQLIYDSHVRCEASSVFTLITCAAVDQSTSLEDDEDVSMPSSGLLFRPIRRRIYGLVFNHKYDVSCDATKERSSDACRLPSSSDNTSRLHSTTDNTSRLHSAANNTLRQHSTPDNTSRLYSTPDNTSRLHSTTDNTSRLHSAPNITLRQHSDPDNTSRLHSTPDNTSRLHSTPDSTSRLHSTPDNTSRTMTCSVDSKPSYVVGVNAVAEWFVYAGFLFKEDIVPVDHPRDSVTLEDLWLSAGGDDVTELRLKTFLNCLHCDIPVESVFSIPEQYLVLCLLLHFMVKQTFLWQMTERDVDALIAQTVCLRTHNEQSLKKLLVPNVNSRAVHLATVFMRGVSALRFANAACNSPIKHEAFLPWRFFDGKLFHVKCIMAEGGAPLNVLCNREVEHMELFERLKSFIIQGTCMEHKLDLNQMPPDSTPDAADDRWHSDKPRRIPRSVQDWMMHECHDAADARYDEYGKSSQLRTSDASFGFQESNPLWQSHNVESAEQPALNTTPSSDNSRDTNVSIWGQSSIGVWKPSTEDYSGQETSSSSVAKPSQPYPNRDKEIYVGTAVWGQPDSDTWEYSDGHDSGWQVSRWNTPENRTTWDRSDTQDWRTSSSSTNQWQRNQGRGSERGRRNSGWQGKTSR